MIGIGFIVANWVGGKEASMARVLMTHRLVMAVNSSTPTHNGGYHWDYRYVRGIFKVARSL